MESGCEMTNAETFETNKAYAKSKPKCNPNIELIHHDFCNNFHSIPISHAIFFLADADQWHSGLQYAQVHAWIHRRTNPDRNVSQFWVCISHMPACLPTSESIRQWKYCRCVIVVGYCCMLAWCSLGWNARYGWGHHYHMFRWFCSLLYVFTPGDKWVFNKFLDRMDNGVWISSFMKESPQQILSTRNGIPTKWVCSISW